MIKYEWLKKMKLEIFVIETEMNEHEWWIIMIKSVMFRLEWINMNDE